jgi:hypothetical protein
MIVLVILAGCQAMRPDFVTRVQGDQWVCDLLDGPMPAKDIIIPGSVKDDVDAILRGIDRAKTAPHIGDPDTSSIAAELPNSIRH